MSSYCIPWGVKSDSPVVCNLLCKLQRGEHGVECRTTCLKLLINKKDSLLLEVPFHGSRSPLLLGLLRLGDGRVQIIKYDYTPIEDGLCGVYRGQR